MGVDPDVRAVVSSGYANDPILERAGGYEFIGAIAKAYTIGRLREALTSLSPRNT